MRALLLLAGLCFATVCSARQVQDTDRYIPLVQDGGGWTTHITLVNLGEKSANFELAFRPPNGFLGRWDLPLAGNANILQPALASGAVPPGGMITVETLGADEETKTGYAVLSRFDAEKIGVEATMRNATTGATISLQLSPAREDFVALRFDNTQGNSTRFVWLSETDFAWVDFTAYDDQGRTLRQGSFEFFANDSFSQHFFYTAERLPELKEQKGVVVIQMKYPSVGFYDEMLFTAAAIHTTASGAMSASPSLSVDSWAPRRY